jgi:uncharacterized YigZ family protein
VVSVSDTYRTVATRASTAFEVRGSRFLGHVDRADDVAEAEAFIDAVATQFPDATHVVPAYRVPATDTSPQSPTSTTFLREYADDDGEPSGSAGKPALNVLQQRAVERVVCAVVRYYGGTNLGVGGLARAYGRAVADALDAAEIVDERPHRTLVVRTDYDDSGTVRGIIESADVSFEATYDARVRFDLRVPVSAVDALVERLNDATSGRVAIE